MIKKSQTSKWIVEIATLLLAIINVPAHSEQYYYTFNGTITSFNEDKAGAIAAMGYQLGDPVTYTFIVDLDARGFLLYPDGRYYYYENWKWRKKNK